ncbi:MAG: long-chain fatty acid--CoA ligase [Gracilimonas sp.]
MYFNDWLSKRKELTPDKEAIIDLVSGKRLDYKTLNIRAENLASTLQNEYKLSAGDRVCVVAKNCLETVDLFFACGKLGVILVPLNFRLPAPAIQDLVENCRPSLFVFGDEYEEMAKSLESETLPILPLHSVKNSVQQFIETNQPKPDIHSAEEEETAMILYTSGTTGKSKGAMISWKQINWNSINTEIGLGITDKDTSIVNTPFYHTGGWHVLLMPLLHHGGKVVLQPEFDPAQTNELIEQENITILFGIPTMLKMMMDQPNFESTDVSSLRFTICGGEACPIPVIQKYKERGIPIRQGYGLTEAGPNCYSLPGEDAIRKQGSVGFPNFHIAVKIVDDNGKEVPHGEVGELWMKGPHVFSGYWNNKKATQQTLENGWVKTGDLFKCDEDGYYYIVGRKKEMYISGGENVYPVQVEKVIYDHPAVSQVAVIGVPDDQWGETGCAFVVLKERKELTSEKLMAYCREYLAGFQCPKHVIFRDELPLGHSNKIQKKALFEIFEQEQQGKTS